jgi:hypothetical protein
LDFSGKFHGIGRESAFLCIELFEQDMMLREAAFLVGAGHGPHERHTG